MVYWDQNTRAARPLAFIATILIRSLPAALALAALRGFDAVGVTVLATALAIRWGTVALTARAFGDVEAMRNLGWLPLRDLAALGSWLTALRARELEWRGLLFDLDPDGRENYCFRYFSHIDIVRTTVLLIYLKKSIIFKVLL